MPLEDRDGRLNLRAELIDALTDTGCQSGQRDEDDRDDGDYEDTVDPPRARPTAETRGARGRSVTLAFDRLAASRGEASDQFPGLPTSKTLGGETKAKGRRP